MRGPRSSAKTWLVVAAVGVAILVIGVALWIAAHPSPNASRNTPPAPPGPPPSINVANETPLLGSLFRPGVILGAASNNSTTLLAGIGPYDKPTGYELPVIGGYGLAPGGRPQIVNLTPALNTQFFEGGVYGAVWNGTAWLLGGQAGWGGLEVGSAALLSGSRLTNLTPSIYPYFVGGGIFSVGWNGSSWLLGGNATWGISLVEITHGTVENLSGAITGHYVWGWIQSIGWNGAEWLIGGRGILGVLTGSRFVDLDPQTPFLNGGVFGAAWGGSYWLVGGTSTRTIEVQGTTVANGPLLPPGFSKWVNFVAHLNGGWLLAGKGVSASGTSAAELTYWDGNDSNATVDLSSLLPSAFLGGEVQGGAPVYGTALYSVQQFLLVGDGGYSDTSGYGLGALALVTVGGTTH